MGSGKPMGHHELVQILANELRKKPYVYKIRTERVYSLGEVDVLSYQGTNRVVYYEIKGKHTHSGYQKALNQLQRWTKHRYNLNKNKNYWGIYYTPQLIEIMYKNGEKYEIHNKRHKFEKTKRQ